MRDESDRPFLPHPSSLIPHPSSLIPHPSSLIPHPSSLIPHPSSLIPHPSSLPIGEDRANPFAHDGVFTGIHHPHADDQLPAAAGSHFDTGLALAQLLDQ